MTTAFPRVFYPLIDQQWHAKDALLAKHRESGMLMGIALSFAFLSALALYRTFQEQLSAADAPRWRNRSRNE